MHRFRAKLYKIGYLRCVDVPAEISRAFGDDATMPVRGRAAGVPFRSTLTPRGNRAHRLFVHSRVWRARDLDLGDSIEIVLERDESREIAPPRDFLRALQDRPVARSAYGNASVAQRREIGSWLAAAKRSGTRERRIEQALDHLEARFTAPAKPGRGSSSRK